VIARPTHRMRHAVQVSEDAADVFVNALPMRRREPGFPVFRAEHEMVVQREMRRSHAGSFQIENHDATMKSAPHRKFSPVPEAREKLAGGATTGQRRRTTNRALEGREKGTRRLAGKIAGEQSHVSRAPAGAQAMWCGPVPVVSPAANLFRASGSGIPS
jgi:hypothetical protein